MTISVRLRRTAINLLLVAVSTLVGLGLGEIGARVFLGDRAAIVPRFHTSAHYGEYTIRRLRPNSHFWHTSSIGSWEFTTNAQGFRADHDYTYDKPKGRIRVLALGDSHTEGFEAHQDRTFTAIAERYLKAHGVDAEVLNTGISGFGTGEELVFLENEGIRYHPDVVVLAFCGNDFDDNVKSGLFDLDEQGHLVARSREFIPGVKILDVINAIPVTRWLSYNSYLYSFALNTTWESIKSLMISKAQLRGYQEYRRPNGKPESYAEILQVRLLERLHEFCRAHGIPLIVVDIPLEKERFDFGSAIPDNLVPAFRANSDILLLSEEQLGRYRGVTDILNVSGSHISEVTHLIYGMAIGDAVLARLPTATGTEAPQQQEGSPAQRSSRSSLAR